jgi:hypothetical protein
MYFIVVVEADAAVAAETFALGRQKTEINIVANISMAKNFLSILLYTLP